MKKVNLAISLRNLSHFGRAVHALQVYKAYFSKEGLWLKVHRDQPLRKLDGRLDLNL